MRVSKLLVLLGCCLFPSYSAMAQSAYPLFFTEVVASNGSIYPDEDGDFEDLIEIANYSDEAINLDGFALSDDPEDPFKWQFGEVTIQHFGFLVVFASGKDRVNHTNFSIKAGGETLVLSAPDGTVLDSFFTGEMRRDISRGRNADAPIEWPYFSNPTPGAANTTEWFLGFADEPEIDVDSGFYDVPFEVTITPETAGDNVFYSVSGAVPTASDFPAGSPVYISQTTIVRAIAFRDGYIPSPTVTRTYFMDEGSDLPIFSIVTDPGLLFDPETGIYVPGPNPGGFPFFPTANWIADIEIPVHVEMFETDGEVAIAQDAGLEISGNFSRVFPKKSLKLKARARYGNDSFEHQLFPDKPLSNFRTFLLRNSGNDYNGTLFNDALVTGLLESTSLDRQAYRPSVVFINGDYWGIHNIRETSSEDYLLDNYGLERDEYDLLDHGKAFPNIQQGSLDEYRRLWEFVESNDMSDPANYEVVKEMIDIDNYLDYMAAEIYVGNRDWPEANIRFYRRNGPGEKWRWIIQDTDVSFKDINIFYESLSAASVFGPGSDAPSAESVFLFGSLLQNEEFREEFIRRMGDMMNIVYEPGRVWERIDQLQGAIETEMPREIERWQFIDRETFDDWLVATNWSRIFASYRPFYMKYVTSIYFGLSGLSDVTIDVQPAAGGSVGVNSKEPENFPWTGEYFKDVPVRLTALAKPGYVFEGWSGGVTSEEAVILVDMTSDISITANFSEGQVVPPPTIAINEINYNSSDTFDPGDWIELVNFGEDAVDISGWVFQDESSSFTMPPETVIDAGDFLVLCNDEIEFLDFFPGIQCLSGFDYGLSGGGEIVTLSDSEGVVIDQLEYDDEAPWPTAADGDGPTLELIDPLLDNSLGESWHASDFNGSPGMANSIP